MSPEEFGHRLGQLRSLLLRARCYYVIMIGLWPTKERVDTFNRFLGFFALARQAFFDSTFLSYAKAYDRNARTASLPVLLHAATNDPKPLAAHGSVAELQALGQLVAENDELVNAIRRLRNRQLAHLDAHRMQGVSIGKTNLDRLADDTERAFNALSRMFNGETTLFALQIENTERHTQELLDSLQKAERIRQMRGAALIGIANLLIEVEKDAATSRVEREEFRQILEVLSDDELSSWIAARDKLSVPGLGTDSNKEHMTRLRRLVDNGLGLET